MCDSHFDANFVDQGLEILLEDMCCSSVATPAVAQPQDRAGIGVAAFANAVPIPAKTVTGKPACIVTQADGDMAAIANQVIDPVRDDDSISPTRKIMIERLERLRCPHSACSIQHSKAFLCFGINRENRVPGVNVLGLQVRNPSELSVPVTGTST